ncbi:MAG: aminopeptidase P family protein [Gemmatimonadales bacterium]|nr:MAG: aminopeptidase P family protein [Gemmatimonadales bacterium]
MNASDRSFRPSAPAPLLEPGAVEEVRSLLDEAGLDGWLLWDFADHNPLAHGLLGLGKTTRRAWAFFPTEGDPRLLRHAIEASSWQHWPWEQSSYASWDQVVPALTELLGGARRVAMEHSPDGAVPTVDRVPGGVLDLVRAAGARVESSGDLVSRFFGQWGPEGLASHRRNARIVRETAHGAFRRAADAAAAGTPVREAPLMGWIRDRLHAQGVSEQVGCIAALGRTASDPHYHPAGEGEAIDAGSLVLVDLWGTEPGGIPADQTWMAWIGDAPDDRSMEVWTAVLEARDAALDLLFRRHREGAEIRGHEVDRKARDVLDARGFGPWFVHRLGHSIDERLHGSGPNLDDLETRDTRLILPGTGFSIEPGVYIPGEIGVRSEVNVYWSDAEGPVVTPDEIQEELLVLPAG